MTKSEPQPTATPSYRLKFLPAALGEWNALDGSVKELFRSALKKRLLQPRLPGSELHDDLRNCYKIKLRKHGYRLVYCVEDDVMVVLVLAIDKRENMAVYRSAFERFISQRSQRHGGNPGKADSER